jgi:sigma-B regulation protein RsbU (phosphoserine phosphatase)
VVKRTFSNAILILGGLLAVYLLSQAVSESVRMVRWGRTGAPRSVLRPLSREGPWVFDRVDTLDFPTPPYPGVGDTITAASGRSLDSLGVTETVRFLTRPQRPGTRLHLAFRRDGVLASTVAVNRRLSPTVLVYLSVAQTLRFLTSFGYIVIGLWALANRPRSGGVRALALFCFAMASFMISQIRVTELAGIDPPFEVPGQPAIIIGLGLLSVCFGAFWLNLQMLFPRPLPPVRRRPLLLHVAVYAPLLAVLGFLAAAGRAAGIWPLIVISAQVALGMVILGNRRGKTKIPLERRQLSLVYYGSGIGLSALFGLSIVWLIPGFAGSLPRLVHLVLPNLTFLALLLSPVSFAYAFGRYRLLEVEGRLRRGTRYLLVAALLLVIFFAVLYAVSQILLEIFDVESRTPTLAVALVLALGFAPVHRRLQLVIERRFYPERRRLWALLNDLLAATPSMPDRATFWSRLEESLRTGLGVAAVIPVQYCEEDESFRSPEGEMVPVDPAGALIRELQESSGSLMVDETVASGRVQLQPNERRWIRDRRVALLLALRIRERLSGFLAVSWGEGGEELKPEDLGLLVSVASQAALVDDNLRLLEENYEKKRLDEELAMARRVQEGLLPKQLPPTPGLEVSARCQFCLEVAGDYYDVVALEGGRTLLAVGDVSGKGAAAALIMANLRASLRTISGAGVSIGDVVGQLNDVMYCDTQSDQFITLFVCVYEPNSRSLSYVNAGHNAPRLVRADGTVESLDRRGLVLGVRSGVAYPVGATNLEPGDTIVAYTDGVSEAMNSSDEEFGEERIVESALPLINGPLEVILDTVRDRALKHTGRDLFEDDFTLIAARVTR